MKNCTYFFSQFSNELRRNEKTLTEHCTNVNHNRCSYTYCSSFQDRLVAFAHFFSSFSHYQIFHATCKLYINLQAVCSYMKITTHFTIFSLANITFTFYDLHFLQTFFKIMKPLQSKLFLKARSFF